MIFCRVHDAASDIVTFTSDIMSLGVRVLRPGNVTERQRPTSPLDYLFSLLTAAWLAVKQDYRTHTNVLTLPKNDIVQVIKNFLY